MSNRFRRIDWRAPHSGDLALLIDDPQGQQVWEIVEADEDHVLLLLCTAVRSIGSTWMSRPTDCVMAVEQVEGTSVQRNTWCSRPGEPESMFAPLENQ